MKKTVQIISSIILISFLSCSGSNETGTATLSFGNTAARGASGGTLPPGITSITVSVSSSDMDTIGPAQVDMGLLSITLDIPSGTNRLFEAKAFSSGRLAYTGSAVSDISGGRNTAVVISMSSANTFSGIWLSTDSATPYKFVFSSPDQLTIFTYSNGYWGQNFQGTLTIDPALSVPASGTISFSSAVRGVYPVFTYSFSNAKTLILTAVDDISPMGTTTYAYQTSYTVSFDANGGTGTPPDSVTELEGYEWYLPSPDAIINGSLFPRRWNTAADGSGTVYYFNDVYTMEARDVTLYVEWWIGPQ